MDNIKYIQIRQMPPGSFIVIDDAGDISENTPPAEDYLIVFNDDSELFVDVMDEQFRIQDTKSGKQRNNFKKKYSFEEAYKNIKYLKEKYGLTDSNQGKIILVDDTNTKKQIIV